MFLVRKRKKLKRVIDLFYDVCVKMIIGKSGVHQDGVRRFLLITSEL